MAKLFVDALHAQQYRLYRPTYPADVYHTIINFCKKWNNKFDKAVDLGCGSGQSTLPLAAHFKHVTGIDPSPSQIQEAETFRTAKSADAANTEATNVDFVVGDAENLSKYQDNSVDLVTCAQSIHWFDTGKFYPEVSRILHKGGVLAAYGYGNVKVDSENGNNIISEFYKGTVGPYWDSRRHHIDNHLAEFTPLPFSNFTRVDSIKIERNMPLSAFIGYISSWSAYQTYIKKHPESTILAELQHRLHGCYNEEKSIEDTMVRATWPVFILLAMSPQT